MNKDYDFCGWATKNDLLCSDGRIIRKGAFDHQDGAKVPLMWNHMHAAASNVLGYAILEHADEGTRAYGYLNDTQQGKDARILLEHGDIQALSICANKLKQSGHDVLHGDIKEVSLVLSPANPGAWIDTVIEHSDSFDEEAIIYTGEPLIDITHSEELYEDEEMDDEVFEEIVHADDEKEEDMGGKDNKDMTVGEVLDTLDEKQKTAVYAIIGGILNGAPDEDDNEEEDKDMKHNVFEGNDVNDSNILTHSDEEQIVAMAKDYGSFQKALEAYAYENDMEIQHNGVTAGGFVQPTTGGFVQPPTAGNVSMLFPEYAEVRPGAPELITNDQTWVSVVMNGVHKSPISRIRTSHVDIRNIDELRAKGYKKGEQKALSGNFALARRTTDPQTVYVRNQLHRDDIVDITDFDYVDYLYKIDRMMLNEELATAILIGDGRQDAAEDKISEDHIRSIWNDDDLYTIHAKVDFNAAKEEIQGEDTDKHFGDNYIWAEAMINAALYARETYKGTGSPVMFITPHMLNVMLLARDFNGRRIYSGVSELATAFNVSKIVTVEQFADKTRTVTVNGVEKTMKLHAMIVNLADYNVGATKGGQITQFNQFDIDFNLQKSLIETRVSGALTRVYSAIAIEEEVNF